MNSTEVCSEMNSTEVCSEMNSTEVQIDEGNKKTSQQGRIFSFPTRYAIPILGFFGYWLLSALRLNLSLTIVAMVNATAVYGSSEGTVENITLSTENTQDGEFEWNPKTQGIILGAFYWTVGVGCIFGGRMSEIFGAKRVFGFGMVIYSVLNLVTPSAARYNWYTLVAVRAIAGFFQGSIFPAFGPLVRRWIPAQERSLVLSVIYGGVHFGSFATILVSGYLCESKFLGGWPSVYYIFGIIGCIWCILFKFLIYELPSEHPWISDKELQYILKNDESQSHKNVSPIPWKSICLSPTVWAALMAAFSVRWAQFHFYTVHPTYMATILKYPIAKNGMLSSLPHLLISIVVMAVGSASDFLRRKKYFTITVIHKSSVTIGTIGYVACIIGVIKAGYDVTSNTVLLIIAMAFTGIAYVGESVVPVDMSPNYAGTLIGLAGLISTTAGFIIPIIIGVLTEEEQTIEQWRILFYISIAVVCFCTLFFDVFGSAETQPWDPPNEKTSETYQCPQILNASVNVSKDDP